MIAELTDVLSYYEKSIKMFHKIPKIQKTNVEVVSKSSGLMFEVEFVLSFEFVMIDGVDDDF